MSSIRPAAAALSEMRPSCGLRRSAMSSFASTFRRVVTPAIIRFGMRCTSCSTPSMRSRTTSASSCGSKWMSLAPSSAAWKMIELTSRTSGASEMPSSTSRSSASSSSASLDERRPLRRSRRGRRRPPRRGRGGGSRSRCPRATRRRARAGSASRAAARRSRARCRGRRSRPGACCPRARTAARDHALEHVERNLAARPPRRRPSAARSMNGSWKRLASVRASPSPVATPSSRIACANEPPCFTRPRTAARRSARDEPGRLDQVGDELGDLVDRRSLRAAPASPSETGASAAPDLPDSRSLLGRLRSIESLDRGIGRTRPES